MARVRWKTMIIFLAAFGLWGVFGVGCAHVESKRPVRDLPAETGRLVEKAIEKYESSDFANLIGEAAPQTHDLVAQFQKSLNPKLRASLSHDPGLDIAAMALIYIYARHQAAPAHSLTRWMFWKFGIAGNPYSYSMNWASGPGAQLHLSRELETFTRRIEAEGKPLSFGIARLQIGEAEYGQSVILAEKRVALQDLPKHYQPGDTLTVRGRILVPFDKPQFYMDLGGNQVYKTEIQPEANGAFSVSVKVPESPGRYFFELVTLDPDTKGKENIPRWQESLLMLPVYVAQEEPRIPDEMIRKPPANPPDRNLWPHRILEIYNMERQKYGMGPITLNPEAGGLATERALEFARNEDLPPDPSVAEKLARRGVPVIDYSQLKGLFEYIDEIAWLNSLSPAHREAIFDSQTTLAGIGIVDGKDQQYAYIEYLLSSASLVDPKVEKEKLFMAVNRLREAKGKPHFQHEPRAEAILDIFTAQVCSGKLSPNDLSPLWDLLKNNKVSYAEARTFFAYSIYFDENNLQTRDHEELISSDFSHLAVGVCQGKLPDLPKGEYVIFLLILPEKEGKFAKSWRNSPMWQDSIVEEVRKIHEAYAKQFNYDLQAIHCDLKEQEKKSGRKIVSFPPKRVKPAEQSAPQR